MYKSVTDECHTKWSLYVCVTLLNTGHVQVISFVRRQQSSSGGSHHQVAVKVKSLSKVGKLQGKGPKVKDYGMM